MSGKAASAAAGLSILKHFHLLYPADTPVPWMESAGGAAAARHVLSDAVSLLHYTDYPRHLDTSLTADGRPLAVEFAPDEPLESVLSRTRFAVFIGAVASPEFLTALKREDMLLFVFEPEEEAMAAFLAALPAKELARRHVFCFLGDFTAYAPGLTRILPQSLLTQGYPAFYLREDLRRSRPGYCRELIERLEVFFYRHVLYPLGGRERVHDVHGRDIARRLTLYQLEHIYENLPLYLTATSINVLKDHFKGDTAILVGAGPDLGTKIGFIQGNLDKALVICVNSALRVLARHGIQPHIALINDTSSESAATMEGLGAFPGTALVAHCLCRVPRDVFGRLYFFGTCLPQVFPARDMIPLHGSVITTAFTLACYLGVRRAVLVGAQLASQDAGSLRYAAGTAQEAEKSANGETGPAPDAPPSLYPAVAADSGTVYTTPNFLDAALWLREEIAASDVAVVNTTASSIIHGRGVRIDPEPAIDPGRVAERLARLPDRPDAVDRGRVLLYIQAEQERWKRIEREAGAVLRQRLDGPSRLALAERLIAAKDSDGTTYLMQWVPGFDYPSFCREYDVSSPPERRLRAACRYGAALCELAQYLQELLEAAAGEVAA